MAKNIEFIEGGENGDQYIGNHQHHAVFLGESPAVQPGGDNEQYHSGK